MEFKYLEHTADLKIEAYGISLENAFENTAKAMFNAIVPLKQISSKIKKQIKIKSEDEKALLFDFLDQLLFLHDSKSLIFNKFKVKIKKNKEYELKAEVHGEKINLKKHKPEFQIKAVTYNEMNIQKNKKFKINVLFDI